MTIDPSLAAAARLHVNQLFSNWMTYIENNLGGGGGTPGGSDTQVQYNNAGAFGGSSSFTWTEATKTLSVTGKFGVNTTTPANDVEFVTNTAISSFGLSTYNSTSAGGIDFSRARGTSSAPAQTLSGDRLFGFFSRGYKSTGAFGGNVLSIAGFAAEDFTGTGNGAYLAFFTTTIGTLARSERVRISDAGFVGIGTTIPTQLVHLEGSSAVRLLVKSTGTTGSDAAAIRLDRGGVAAFANLAYLTASTQYWAVGMIADGTNNYLIKDQVTGFTPITIESGVTVSNSIYIKASNGYVGFLNTNPAAPIDVTGNGIFSGSVTASSFIGSGTSLTGVLLSANNLSDVANQATSRSNLGLVAIASSGSASDLTTGTVPAGRMPALTGDVTSTIGTVATTVGSIGGKAVSLGGSLTFSGAFTTTITVTGNTSVTLPTSGTLLSANQNITLSGDVTGSGATSIASTIANSAVTNAKMANMATLTIKGNNTGGSAAPIDLTVAQVNTMLGTPASSSWTLLETITVNTNTITVTIGSTAGLASYNEVWITCDVINTNGSATCVVASFSGDNGSTFNNISYEQVQAGSSPSQQFTTGFGTSATGTVNRAFNLRFMNFAIDYRMAELIDMGVGSANGNSFAKGLIHSGAQSTNLININLNGSKNIRGDLTTSTFRVYGRL